MRKIAEVKAAPSPKSGAKKVDNVKPPELSDEARKLLRQMKRPWYNRHHIMHM